MEDHMFTRSQGPKVNFSSCSITSLLSALILFTLFGASSLQAQVVATYTFND
jgi:hypothetical protein